MQVFWLNLVNLLYVNLKATQLLHLEVLNLMVICLIRLN